MQAPREIEVKMVKPAAFIFLFFFSLVISFSAAYSLASSDPDPVPTPWPDQFHATSFVNGSSGILSIHELWYDRPNDRCLYTFQFQLQEKLYFLLDNGTYYYYTLDPARFCLSYYYTDFPQYNFSSGANYIGQASRDGFLSNVWEINNQEDWYYEDVATKRPVGLVTVAGFNTGRSEHTMAFEVGKLPDDNIWQPPVLCFARAKVKADNIPVPESIMFGLKIRGVPILSVAV